MLALVLLTALFQGSSEIVAVADSTTTDQQLAEACKVIERRCLAYGYDGVRAEVNGQSIRLRSDTGFTQPMECTIASLIAYKGAAAYVALRRTLTVAEEQQFTASKLAPKGAMRAIVIAHDMEVNLVSGPSNIFVMKDPAVKPTLVRNQRADVDYVEISQDGFKQLLSAGAYKPDPVSGSPMYAMLVIDDSFAIDLSFDLYKPKTFNRIAKVDEKAVSMARIDKIVSIVLRNPMPIRLKQAKK